MLNKISTALGVRKKEVHILVVGLDNAGKSSILNQLRPAEARLTRVSPTVGIDQLRFDAKQLTFVATDVSGQGRYRSTWSQYYSEVQAIIFVVDATDKLRLAVAADELAQLLGSVEMQSNKCPLLILANKMDERGAIGAVQVSRELGAERVHDRQWHAAATSANTGLGLLDAVDWLSQAVKRHLDS